MEVVYMTSFSKIYLLQGFTEAVSASILAALFAYLPTCISADGKQLLASVAVSGLERLNPSRSGWLQTSSH